MDLNSVLFPAPPCSYSTEDLQGELIWIPKLSASHLEEFRASMLLSEPGPESNHKPISFNSRLQKGKHTLAFSDSIAKPETKDQDVDCMSVFTMYSAKNTPVKDASFSKGGGSNESSPTRSTFQANDQKLSNFSNQSKLAFHSPVAIGNDILDSVNVSSSCIEEKNFNVLPMSETQLHLYKGKITPLTQTETASLNSGRIMNKLDLFDNIPGKLLPHSSQRKDVNFMPQKQIQDEDELMDNDENIKIEEPQSKSKKTYNKGVLKFNPEVFEELIENRKMAGNMRRIPSSFSKDYLGPINEKFIGVNKAGEQIKVSNTQYDLVTDYVEDDDEEDVTIRYQEIEQHAIIPLLFAEKSLALSMSMLSPSPLKRGIQNTTLATEAAALQTLTDRTVPRYPAKAKEQISGFIPCRFLCSLFPTNKILVYFHGNGEDIYLSSDLLIHIRNNMNINVLAVEYPGYGLYKGTTTEGQILKDSEFIYEFLTIGMRMNPADILVFGRSIGSGPATYLASKRKVGALVLMSAFTSIRSAVKDIAGPLAQFFIKERFNNVEAITRVYCPTFIVHGQKDALIPFQHSQHLHNACKGPSELVLPKTMDHIEFNFYDDFTTPLYQFLDRIGFEWDEKNPKKIYFPQKLFEIPEDVKTQIEKIQIQSKILIKNGKK